MQVVASHWVKSGLPPCRMINSLEYNTDDHTAEGGLDSTSMVHTAYTICDNAAAQTSRILFQGYTSS